jgi:hypothetical protein
MKRPRQPFRCRTTEARVAVPPEESPARGTAFGVEQPHACIGQPQRHLRPAKARAFCCLVVVGMPSMNWTRTGLAGAGSCPFPQRKPGRGKGSGRQRRWRRRQRQSADGDGDDANGHVPTKCSDPKSAAKHQRGGTSNGTRRRRQRRHRQPSSRGSSSSSSSNGSRPLRVVGRDLQAGVNGRTSFEKGTKAGATDRPAEGRCRGTLMLWGRDRGALSEARRRGAQIARRGGRFAPRKEVAID